jgi:hypothetical protein
VSYQGAFVGGYMHGVGTVTRKDGSCFQAAYSCGSMVREVKGACPAEAGDVEAVQVVADAVGDGFRRAEQNGDVIDLLE